MSPMNVSLLLEYMEECKDSLDPIVEEMFKNSKPDQDEDPEIAFRYWQMHMDIYGTPSRNSSVRAMFYNFKALHDSDDKEMARLTEIITTLRQELKEAKARNTLYLSRLQEHEAREQ